MLETLDKALALAVVAVNKPPAEAEVTEKALADLNVTSPPTRVLSVLPLVTVWAVPEVVPSALSPCTLMVAVPLV